MTQSTNPAVKSHMGPPVEEAKITFLDLRIVLSVLICLLSAELLNQLGIKYHYGKMDLEILQHMTAAISCLLVCQKDGHTSTKAGINRIILTAIGGGLGIVIALFDNYIFYSPWLDVLLITIGVLAALFLCKLAGLPYVNARIGGVTCILVAGTLSGTARVPFAIFRFISTIYGAVISVLVTMLMLRLFNDK